MPRRFTDEEKELIRRELLGKGRRMFEMYGLRKTNVDELTSAVGISKGAFYLFFESKEELFFEVLQQAEAEVKRTLLTMRTEPRKSVRQQFGDMLKHVLMLWKSSPLFAQVSKPEYEHLLRKLPPAKVEAHLAGDATFAEKFVAHWQAMGARINVEPVLVSELIRSLFFVSLHEHEFGAGMYPRVVAVLIDGIAQYIVGEETNQL